MKGVNFYMRRKGKMALALVLAAATVLPGMSISAHLLPAILGKICPVIIGRKWQL